LSSITTIAVSILGQPITVVAARIRSCSESPRSGRQHKAWGASPRTRSADSIEPAKRATEVSRFHTSNRDDLSVTRSASFLQQSNHPIRSFLHVFLAGILTGTALMVKLRKLKGPIS
jgi:hypothetical protein